MSWGERSCKAYGYCEHNPTVKKCNDKCKYYECKIHMTTFRDGKFMCPKCGKIFAENPPIK